MATGLAQILNFKTEIPKPARDPANPTPPIPYNRVKAIRAGSLLVGRMAWTMYGIGGKG